MPHRDYHVPAAQVQSYSLPSPLPQTKALEPAIISERSVLGHHFPAFPIHNLLYKHLEEREKRRSLQMCSQEEINPFHVLVSSTIITAGSWVFMRTGSFVRAAQTQCGVNTNFNRQNQKIWTKENSMMHKLSMICLKSQLWGEVKQNNIQCGTTTNDSFQPDRNFV